MIKDTNFKLGHEIDGFRVILMPSHVQDKGSAVLFLNKDDYEVLAEKLKKQKAKCPTCKSTKFVVAWGPGNNKCAKCNVTWTV